MYTFLTVWSAIIKEFQQKISVLQREGANLNTSVCLLESLQEYIRALHERYQTFEDEAKENFEKQAYAKDKSRKYDLDVFGLDVL